MSDLFRETPRHYLVADEPDAFTVKPSYSREYVLVDGATVAAWIDQYGPSFTPPIVLEPHQRAYLDAAFAPEAAMRRRFHQDLLALRRQQDASASAGWEAFTTALEALQQAAVDAWKGLQPLIAAIQRAQISTRDQYVLYPNDFLPDVDHKPTDPRARALWLRQHRNTGPARPNAQTARRPR